ncbi:MAG: S8 family serine peptidase, partial [Chitinophagaceae bacterium]|nr:S8 family serine peptidase [Anaerolineae bacterium]
MRTNLHKRIGFLIGVGLVSLIWLLAVAMLVKEPQAIAVASQPAETTGQVVAAAPQAQDISTSNTGGPAIQALGGSLNEARIAEAQQAYGQPQAVVDAPAPNITIADSGSGPKIEAPAPIAPAPIVAPPDGSPVQIIPPQAQVPNQIVVQFNPNSTAAERAAYITSIGGVVVQELPALNSAVISVTVRADTPLASPAVVAQTEPDYYIAALEEPMQSQQWALPVIGAPDAWADLNADAPLVTVAVIDSGVCLEHPDLAGRTVAGYDFVDGDTTAQDDFGHGCSVAGIIAADGSNGQGIAGVAPNARIMPLRVLNAQGIGQYSNVAAAIVYAADNGAQIINLS